MGVIMVDMINFNKAVWTHATLRPKTVPTNKTATTISEKTELEKLRQIQEKIQSGKYVVNVDQLADRLSTLLLKSPH